MGDRFDYDTFLEKVEIDEYGAMKYKQKFIPDVFYKYQPIGIGRMRQKRLKAIKSEQIWASRTKYLNDPFEFKMLYANQKNDEVKAFYEDVLERNEVICLSGQWDNKLMWSHYADSHSGVCLEYSFNSIRKELIFPISYVAKRQNYEKGLLEWLHNKEDAINRLCNYQNMTNIQKRQMHYCGKIMFTKDIVWKYEKEYRIVTRNHLDIANGKYDAYKEQKGSIHKTEEFDLMLSKIYLGMNCTEENRELIINAVRKANDKRLRDAIGRSKKDKLQMYHVLYNMGEIITVWEVYADDALRLKKRNINVDLIS